MDGVPDCGVNYPVCVLGNAEENDGHSAGPVPLWKIAKIQDTIKWTNCPFDSVLPVFYFSRFLILPPLRDIASRQLGLLGDRHKILFSSLLSLW